LSIPAIQDGWHIAKPDLIVPIPQPFAVPAEGVIPYQLFEVDPEDLSYGVRKSLRKLGLTPRELLGSLHVGYLVLTERRPSGEARPLAHLVEGAQPLAIFDPSGRAHGCDEAFLPTEMDFPLTALWQVERPGPRLEIYRLAR